jgi:hypothetical protein
LYWEEHKPRGDLDRLAFTFLSNIHLRCQARLEMREHERLALVRRRDLAAARGSGGGAACDADDLPADVEEPHEGCEADDETVERLLEFIANLEDEASDPYTAQAMRPLLCADTDYQPSAPADGELLIGSDDITAELSSAVHSLEDADSKPINPLDLLTDVDLQVTWKLRNGTIGARVQNLD